MQKCHNNEVKKKYAVKYIYVTTSFFTSWIHRRMKAMDLVLSCLLLSAVTGLGEMYGKKVTFLLLEHLFTKYTFSYIAITIPLKKN